MSLPKSQQFMSHKGGNPGHDYRKKSVNRKCSSGDAVHPYMKASFWANPSNQFWETELYSEASKEYFRKSLQA